jgi:hypothetical protein
VCWDRSVYYEETKRELKRILIYECRCNERLKVKSEGSRRLAYTGLIGGLEPLKIETRLRGGRFQSVKGECDPEAIGAPSMFKLIREDASLAKGCVPPSGTTVPIFFPAGKTFQQELSGYLSQEK